MARLPGCRRGRTLSSGSRCRRRCPDVPDRFLDPRATWADPIAYDRMAAKLARMFIDNFEAFADGVGEAVRTAGPRAD